MIKVFKTVAAHFCIILTFLFLYYYFANHFETMDQVKKEKRPSRLESLVDFLLLSTTIEAGVGISDIVPITIYGKLLMILQQFAMLSLTVITIFIFTKKNIKT